MEETKSWEERLPRLGLGLDIAMLSLVIINLSWIVFDSLFSFGGIQSMLAFVVGQPLVDWYDTNVHQWFFFYDLAFVAVFVTELLARWIYAIRRKTYSHWLVYPILHWYDVLGCIPIGELRWLRVLRVIAVLVRLQKMQVIDYTQWGIYQLFARWFNIGMEELSDRIAVKILEGVQQEVASGEGLDRKIVNRVIAPRKDMLVNIITQRMAHLFGEVYEDSKDELEAYIKAIVSGAMKKNPELRGIEAVPMLGTAVGKVVHHTVNNIVCQSLGIAVDSMKEPAFHDLVDQITETVLASIQADDPQDSSEMNSIIIDVIEVIKEEVQIQRWRDAPPASSNPQGA
ncbi:MAG: ion transporter [Nevskiales bacterium]